MITLRETMALLNLLLTVILVILVVETLSEWPLVQFNNAQPHVLYPNNTHCLKSVRLLR